MATKKQIQLIHIAKHELNIKDLIYRDILRANSGKESAKDLTPGEANKVLDHLKALGWKIKSSKAVDSKQLAVDSNCQPSTGHRQPKRHDDLGKRPGMATPAQLRLIEVTWVNNQHVREKTPEALRKFIEHRFGISGLRFIEGRDVGKVLKAIGSIKSKTI